MTVPYCDSRDSLAAILGPTDTLRAEFVDDALALADEARQQASDALMTGRTEAGAAMLAFAERLTLLAGGQR
jgi:hypothetical protein